MADLHRTHIFSLEHPCIVVGEKFPQLDRLARKIDVYVGNQKVASAYPHDAMSHHEAPASKALRFLTTFFTAEFYRRADARVLRHLSVAIGGRIHDVDMNVSVR